MDRPEELEFAWLMFVGILLMFLLSMAVVIFFVYYQRKLHRQQTAMERLKLEEQKKLLQAEVKAQENERARIARDLHDEIGTLLSTVKLHLTHRHPKTENKPNPVAEEILDEAILKLRSIAQNLLPENLRLFGLTNAIERTCWQLEETGTFSVDFQHRLEQRLADEAEIHLYRIVQELFNNTIKHANATAVFLSLYQKSSRVVLTYEDNGVGFSLNQPRDSVGLGLATLNSRVQILNGEIDINSAHNKGVHILITFPLHTT